MKNKAFERAKRALSHPVSVGTVLLLLCNDHILRQLEPSWWTGKIGDFAWLVFAPLVLAAILAWLIPSRLEYQEKAVGCSAFVLIGLWFTLAKTLPSFHDWTVRLFGMLTGQQASLLLDPTDLLMSPALLIGWHIWRHAEIRPSVSPRRGWIALSLAALALVADAAAPDYGINCLIEQDSTLIAPAAYGHTFLSQDGGITWQEDNSVYYESECTQHTTSWIVSDPSDVQVSYRFTPSVAIERSEDGGQTWRREISLSWKEAQVAYYYKSRQGSVSVDQGPLDALVSHPAGYVVVAMGHDGVLVRTADTQWRWIAVGTYHRAELNRLDQMWSLLYGEFWLAVMLIPLFVGALALRQVKSRIVYILFAVLSWVSWGAAVFIAPAFLSGYGSILLLLLPASAVFVLPLGLDGAWQLRRLSPRAVIRAVVTAVIGMFLFLLPYILWSQGVISSYQIARICAVLLGAATLFVGDRYLQRFLKTISRPAQVVINP
jgi:hypothetical protein